MSDRDVPSSANAAPRWLKPLAITAAFAIVIGFFVVTKPPEVGLTADAGLDAEVQDGAPLEPRPRCAIRSGHRGLLVGTNEARVVDPTEGQLEPFAVELGRGTSWAEGHAVGARQQGRALAALVDPASGAGRLVELGPVRGDWGAPLLAGAGDLLVVGLLEPNAAGAELRLGRIAAPQVKWRAQLDQGYDESLAFDVALGEGVAVVVWDDVTKDDKRSRVKLAALGLPELETMREPRAVSPPPADAELPRVASRPGGFWLAYLVRAEPAEAERDSNPDEDDGGASWRYPAEAIAPSWLEVALLARDGTVEGAPQTITPADGHVQAFDVERGAEGSLIVAWRDDDTPSGAQGGQVRLRVVRAGGPGPTTVIAETDVGAGVPNLLPGWLAISMADGGLRLAPLGPNGELGGDLRTEPALGRGQLLAARQGSLLLAKPYGRAADLVTVDCDPTLGFAPAPADASPPDPERSEP